MTQNTGTTRGSIPPPPSRPGRSGSILRRPSTSSRQTSVSSVVSSSSGGTLDAPSAPAAMRNRRQSQFPPVSNAAAPRPPRKSMGPGVIADSDLAARNAPARRTSLLGDKNAPRDSTRRSIDGGSVTGSDSTRNLPTSRAIKAKSVQPPPRTSQTNLLGGSTLTPEQHRLSTLAPRSPRVGAKAGTPSSGSSKRMSMMPGSHATGLGAHINNRKSYSSGLSVGSTASYNTVRTSTGSVQPRLPLPSSATRLPAPKHGSTHNNLQTDDDEDVPPVPAIPKAYESPKESHAETYFMEKKKSSLNNLDSTSIHSNSTSSISMPVHLEPTKVQQKANVRKNTYAGITAVEEENQEIQSRKQLEPLSLPPLNIGPLNFPSTSKVNGQTSSHRDLSPPPSRQVPKTPTTPMTASKSSFFSKSRYDETLELPSLRSSTSAHHIRRVTQTPLMASLQIRPLA
ncbi:serine/threonine protein kinase, CMGC, dual-specificity [Metarhizium acridum]|nr:serine/threonine protein kinase, CMGC, dual-specificity [Metarhizium acridum]